MKTIKEKRESIDARGTIDVSIELLKSLGYGDKVSEIAPTETSRKREVIILRNWQDIVNDAEQKVGDACELEDLFTEEELCENSEAIRLLNRERRLCIDAYELFRVFGKSEKFNSGTNAVHSFANDF